MKSKLVNYVLIACFACASLFSTKAYSQIDIMGRLLSGGIDDAEKLSEAYFNPFIDGFSANLNSGWYNTAKPHSVLGFDITVNLNTSIVPASSKYYDLGLLELNGVVNGDNKAPTFSGKQNSDRPELIYYEEFAGNDVELTRFKVPNGTGVGYIPAPMLQVGIGLPLKTDIMIRYLPDMNLGSAGKMGLYGFGLKHSLKQWIPFIKKLPIVNVSVMGGYTRFSTSSSLNVKPEDINADATDLTENVSFDNQSLVFDVNSYTANLIGSVDIPFFTVYGAVGFTSNTANLKMLGYYPIPELNSSGDVVFTDESVGEKDPINFTVQGDANKTIPRYNLGMKLKLGLFHLNFDYTYAHYSVASLGMALSFR